MKPAPPSDEALAARALAADKHAIATLISLFEDRRPAAVARRRAVLAYLDAQATHRRAVVLGITGTPGAGKSTLVGQLALKLVTEDERALRAGVLAVDPSSQFSGGALLGDRTRVRFPAHDGRLFFRSQASDTELGGLSPVTFQVSRLMMRLFDVVFVETVGIGQSEIDVKFLADRVYLVMQPFAGDEVQFLKAGIMEVPDAIVLNKADAEAEARRSYHSLKASLALARPGEADRVSIYRTSATTGLGLDTLVAEMRKFVAAHTDPDPGARERHYFRKHVKDEWGRVGLRFLEDAGGVGAYLAKQGGFELAQDALSGDVRVWLASR